MIDLVVLVFALAGVFLALAVIAGLLAGVAVMLRIVVVVTVGVFRPRPRCACVCYDALCKKHPMIPSVIAYYPCADARDCPIHGPVLATANLHRSRR